MRRSFSLRQARRLRRLAERRLAAFEALVEAEGQSDDIAALERQSKALIALIRALEAVAGIEGRAASEEAKPDDDAALRRLAHRLEALLAENGPPRPAAGAEPGAKAPDRRQMGADRP